MGALPKAAPCPTHQLDQAESPRVLPALHGKASPCPGCAWPVSIGHRHFCHLPSATKARDIPGARTLLQRAWTQRAGGQAAFLSSHPPRLSQAGQDPAGQSQPHRKHSGFRSGQRFARGHTTRHLVAESGELGTEAWLALQRPAAVCCGTQPALPLDNGDPAWDPGTHVLRAPRTSRAPWSEASHVSTPHVRGGCGTCPKGLEQRSPGDTRLSAPTVLPCTRSLSSTLHPPATA